MSSSYQKLRLDSFDLHALSSAMTESYFEQRLLKGGKFQAELDHLQLPDCRLDRGIYSLPCLGLGAVPEGWLNIGVNYCPRSPGWVNGLHIGLSHLQIFSEGSPIDYQNVPGSAWYAFQIQREFLQETALRIIGKEIPIPQRGFKSYHLPDAVALLFHRHLEFTLRTAQLLERCGQQAAYGLLQHQLVYSLAHVFRTEFHQLDRQLELESRSQLRSLFILENYLREKLQAGLRFEDLMTSVSLIEGQKKSGPFSLYSGHPRTTASPGSSLGIAPTSVNTRFYHF